MRDWLVTLRNEKKMAAQEVASAVGVSPAYYSLIESGKRQKTMDITLVFKLAPVLGVSVSEIIECEHEYAKAQN